MKQIWEREKKPKSRPNNIKKANESRDQMTPSVSVDFIQNNQYGTYYPHWGLELDDLYGLFQPKPCYDSTHPKFPLSNKKDYRLHVSSSSCNKCTGLSH